MSEIINNISDNDLTFYQRDNTKPEYYPQLNGMIFTQDGADEFIRNLAFAKQQLMFCLLDDFAVIDEYDFLSDDDSDENAQGDDNIISIPDNIVSYNNTGYLEYEDKTFVNTNVPLGWNCLHSSTLDDNWEEITVDVTATSGDWPSAVANLGKWYEENIHTYQSDPKGVNIGNHPGRKAYECSLFPSGPKKVMDDCTSFCMACIQFYWDIMHDQDPANCDEEIYKKVMAAYPPCSIDWGDIDTSAAKNMADYGFEVLHFSEADLKPFDMVMGSKRKGSKHGHGEIYAGTFGGRKKSWGWGNVHDKANGGMPAGYVTSNYNIIFRMKGQEENINNYQSNNPN